MVKVNHFCIILHLISLIVDTSSLLASDASFFEEIKSIVYKER